MNHVGKDLILCDSISTATTFTTEACYKTFKIKCGPLTCDSKKVIYLLKHKTCGEVPYVGRAKTKFLYRFSSIKVNIERLKRVIGKFARNYFTLTIVLMALAALKIKIL